MVLKRPRPALKTPCLPFCYSSRGPEERKGEIGVSKIESWIQSGKLRIDPEKLRIDPEKLRSQSVKLRIGPDKLRIESENSVLTTKTQD